MSIAQGIDAEVYILSGQSLMEDFDMHNDVKLVHLRSALQRIARGTARDGGVADPAEFARETLDTLNGLNATKGEDNAQLLSALHRIAAGKARDGGVPDPAELARDTLEAFRTSFVPG